MRVGVVGAGVVGVTTAYALATDGHEVTVFERRGSAAAESSFANAGLVSPGRIEPWASPAYRRLALAGLLSRHPPFRLHAKLSPGEVAWLWRWWRAGGDRPFEANRTCMQRLASFSLAQLRAVTRSLKLEYERDDGCLMLFRSSDDRARAETVIASLASTRQRFGMLDAAQCRAVEPGLSADPPLHGGVYLPDDEVGNCRQFTALLRGEAQRLGVRFRFHTQVQQISGGSAPRIAHLYAPPEQATVLLNVPAESAPNDALDTVPMALLPIDEAFDAVVVCAAIGSDHLLRPLGLKLPMQAVYGYSVTAPLRRLEAHGDIGPHAALIDERYQVAISRLGARVRVAGGFEFGGAAGKHDAKSLAVLYKVLHDWFPGSVRMSQAQVWKGARAMLPDGAPVLGRSGVAGIWLNLAHGGNGWALACGSARVLADAVSGRSPVVDTEVLGVHRLKG